MGIDFISLVLQDMQDGSGLWRVRCVFVTVVFFFCLCVFFDVRWSQIDLIKIEEKNNSILSMKVIHHVWNVHNASCLLLVWYIVWSYNCCGKCHMLKSIFASVLDAFCFLSRISFLMCNLLWEAIIRQFFASFCLEVDPAIWLRPANVNTWSVYSVLICNKISVEKKMFTEKSWVEINKYWPSWS